MLRMCLALWLLCIRSANSVSFTVNTGVGGCGQPVPVSALLLDDFNNPIRNATVTLSSNGQTQIGLTDQNGEYTTTFDYSEPNTYALQASYINGSAIFAEWTAISGSPGSYQGILPGEIVIRISATEFSPLQLTYTNLSDASTFEYPGSSSAQVILYNCDDSWNMSMSSPVDNLLLYMQGWDPTQQYTFDFPFVLISPFQVENPPTTVLKLNGPPWDVGSLTFSGLLQFPASLSDLTVQASPTSNEIEQFMTLALTPLQGFLSTDITVACCVPSNPQLTYQGQPFVPNIWPWTPSFQLTVDGLPVAGQQIIITAYDQSNGNSKTSFASCTTGLTDATGTGTCLLTTAIGNRDTVSLTARFAGNGCDLTSVTTQVQVLVFGFPDSGKHAFVISNNTDLDGKVVFWGLDWALQNKFPNFNSISFGGYCKTDLSNPTCSGTFTWNPLAAILNPLPPNSLPQYMGVLVSSKFNFPQLNGTWNRIIVLGKIKYSSKPLLGAGYGTYLGTYCPTGSAQAQFGNYENDPSQTTTAKTIKIPKLTTRRPTHKPTTKKPTKKPAKSAKPSH